MHTSAHNFVFMQPAPASRKKKRHILGTPAKRKNTTMRVIMNYTPIRQAFQAGKVGSIPITRSIL